MRPLTVITAIILGSCLAISICLVAVWVLLTLVSSDPVVAARVSSELGQLPRHIAIFIPTTLIAAQAFISSQKQGKYRFIWQLILWAVLGLIGFYYASVMT